MKYYTLEWWNGHCEDASVIKNYWDYFDSIKMKLPNELIVFSKTIRLHDSNLLEINSNNILKELNLKFNIYKYNTKGNSIGKQHLIMKYSGVQSLNVSSTPELGLGGPKGFGDLGYDEIDIETSNIFIHRILFSSSIEFEIKFSSFNFNTNDIEQTKHNL